MLRDHICLSIYISSTFSIYLLPSSSDILLASLSPNLCKYTFGNAHRTLQINTQTEYIWPHIWQGKHTFRPEPIKPERIADDTIESSLGGKKQNLLFKVWLLCAIKGLRTASLFSRFFFLSSSSFVLVFYSSLVCFPDSFFLSLLLFLVFLLINSLFSRFFFSSLFLYCSSAYLPFFSFYFLSLFFYSSSVYFLDSFSFFLFLLLLLIFSTLHQSIFQIPFSFFFSASFLQFSISLFSKHSFPLLIFCSLSPTLLPLFTRLPSSLFLPPPYPILFLSPFLHLSLSGQREFPFSS